MRKVLLIYLNVDYLKDIDFPKPPVTYNALWFSLSHAGASMHAAASPGMQSEACFIIVNTSHTSSTQTHSSVGMQHNNCIST